MNNILSSTIKLSFLGLFYGPVAAEGTATLPFNNIVKQLLVFGGENGGLLGIHPLRSQDLLGCSSYSRYTLYTCTYPSGETVWMGHE